MPEHFFVVGAQRSGTTYLYGLLDEHPDIQMAKPLRPEPKFFLDDDLHALGLATYERRYFDPAGPAVRGEKSTSYIESETAAARIAAAFPDATIIAVLRDPVERAVSNYRLSRDSGLETRSIDSALGSDDLRPPSVDGWFEVAGLRISASPFAYRARGRYADHLAAYADRFPPERLVVLLFERLVGNADVIAGVYAALGVDPAFRPAGLDEVVNPGGADHEPLSPEVAARLAGVFADANTRLADRYDLDLSVWPSARS